MLIEFDLPEVPRPRAETSNYWSRYFFIGSPSENYQVNAIANTFMRLTEAAIIEYNLGCSSLRDFWDNSSSSGLSSMHKAIAHFETCITDMHRAIRAFRCLRSHKDKDPLSTSVISPKPNFINNKIADPVRNMRDAIHHLEEKIIKGEIVEGEPIAIKPDGNEIPHPSLPGQTIKTIDRLVIGPHQLTFAEMATCLNELSSAASRLSQYERR